MRPMRHDGEESDPRQMRIAQDGGGLTEIFQQQRRQRHEEPGLADRRFAEMAHVGIKRLATGHGQHHRTERNESVPRLVQENLDRVPGIDRNQHLRRLRQRDRAQHGQHGEPQHHERTEQHADLRGAAALHREQRDEDDERQRNDERLECPAPDAQTFDRGQNGNRRRQHPVAKEEREPDDGADADGHLDAAPDARRAMRQRCQRQRPAFAVIVRAHDEHDIFQRHHDKERPDDERQGADGVVVVRKPSAGCEHRFAHRVERAGADIAEHDTQRAQHQHPVPPPAARRHGVGRPHALRVEFQRVGQTRLGIAHRISGRWFIDRTTLLAARMPAPEFTAARQPRSAQGRGPYPRAPQRQPGAVAWRG